MPETTFGHNQLKATTMSNEKRSHRDQTVTSTPTKNNSARGSSRRRFLGQVGAALAGGAVFGRSAIAAAQSENPANPPGPPPGSDHSRVEEAKRIRYTCANNEAHIHVPPHPTNGDAQS